MKNYRKQSLLHNSIITFSFFLSLIIILEVYNNYKLYWLLIVVVLLLGIGIYSLLQKKTLRRKYYFNNEQADIPKTDFKWLPKSVNTYINTEIDFSIIIGNDQCKQPCKAVVFNVETTNNKQNPASLSKVLQKEISGSTFLKTYIPCTYSFEDGLVWQIGPAYAGCNTNSGNFNSEIFKRISSLPQIKMIELLLPSSNKYKKSDNIFLDNNKIIVPKIKDSIFDEAGYSNFIEAEGTIHFLDNLRKLCNGKPVGIRLCIDNKKDFYKICYAIRKLHFFPDYIVIEESTAQNATNGLNAKHITKIPLYEALQFVKTTLQNYALENKIKIIAAGKIISSLDIVKALALGADLVYTKMHNNFTANNFLGNTLCRNNKSIVNLKENYIKGITKIMHNNGFINICDLTLPNFIRNMESFEKFDNEDLYRPLQSKIYVEKLTTPNTCIIKVNKID